MPAAAILSFLAPSALIYDTHLYYPGWHSLTQTRRLLQKAICNLRYQLSIRGRKYCEAWNCVHRLLLIASLVYCSCGLRFLRIDQVTVRHVRGRKGLPPYGD